jgi:hypothetical protein
MLYTEEKNNNKSNHSIERFFPQLCESIVIIKCFNEERRLRVEDFRPFAEEEILSILYTSRKLSELYHREYISRFSAIELYCPAFSFAKSYMLYLAFCSQNFQLLL